MSDGSQVQEAVQSTAYLAFLSDYLPIVFLLAIALIISLAFLLMAKIFAPSSPDAEKISTYECGFNAFDDSRMKFDVRFYLVAILFIIFDLEVAFLFPWAVSLEQIGVYGWSVVMIFLVELAIGLIYAWKKGALDWE
ncbi:MAG: NADH-quinone oxidoreductase subunit A [Robiginitomaculum sp.]|nr:MAG: NADH-quinone oxidoreductase subunit A [Robiginitomaculum sp.]